MILIHINDETYVICISLIICLCALSAHRCFAMYIFWKIYPSSDMDAMLCTGCPKKGPAFDQ